MLCMTFLNLQLFYFELYFSEFMFTYFKLKYQIDNTCLLVCATLQDINSNLVTFKSISNIDFSRSGTYFE